MNVSIENCKSARVYRSSTSRRVILTSRNPQKVQDMERNPIWRSLNPICMIWFSLPPP